MSFRAMRIINGLAQVVAMITLMVGYFWLLNLAGSLAEGGLLVTSRRRPCSVGGYCFSAS